MRIQFPKPLFFPAKVEVKGRLKHFNAERNMGLLAVTITDLAKLWTVLEGEVSFALHAVKDGSAEAIPAPVLAQAARTTPAGGRRRLLATGGTGGIGSDILRALAAHYDISCLTRAARTNGASAGIEYLTCDLEQDSSAEKLLAGLSPAEFHGILHMSSPPMSRGFVSDDLGLARRHLRQSVELPLLLAQWARRAGSSVKRLVLLGSTAGTTRPQPHAGAYSLGKAALEDLARLLVADLAGQGATVSVVVPTVVPVGMNEGMPERSRKALAGRMPTGRLVETSDIAPVIEFLLSDASSQINGSSILVDGGLAE